MRRATTIKRGASLFLGLSVSLSASVFAQNQNASPARDPQGAASKPSTGSPAQPGQSSTVLLQTLQGRNDQLGVRSLVDPYANNSWNVVWSDDLMKLQGQTPIQVGQGNLSYAAGNGMAWFTLPNPSSGMDLAAADDSLREHLQLPKDQGLVVLSLTPLSPPAQAGIQQNDVLLQVGDDPVAKPEELDDRLKHAGNEPVSLTVLRGGKRLKLRVQPQVNVTLGPVQAEAPEFWIGVSVTPVGPALRSQLQLPQDKGMAVIDIVKDSAAQHAGIKLHDILLSLAGKPLTDQEHLVDIVQKNGEKSAALELIREGKTQTIEITPQRRKTVRTRDEHNKALSHYYRVLQPGALVQHWERPAAAGPITIDNSKKDLLSRLKDDPVSKRLDQLDAELKQLRKAIEELSKSVKDK
jgi:serine protease Do